MCLTIPHESSCYLFSIDLKTNQLEQVETKMIIPHYRHYIESTQVEIVRTDQTRWPSRTHNRTHALRIFKLDFLEWLAYQKLYSIFLIYFYPRNFPYLFLYRELAPAFYIEWIQSSLLPVKYTILRGALQETKCNYERIATKTIKNT